MLALTWGGAARAQPIPPTCDPLVYDAHEARAWMGAKRDMESAQSIITVDMGDSLLYMSCFDFHVRDMAEKDATLFSDGAFRFVNTAAPFGTLFRMPPLCFAPGCLCVPWLTGCAPFQMPIDIYEPTFLPAPGPNPPGPVMNAMNLDRSVNMLVRWSLRPYWRDNFEQTVPPIPLPGPPAVICGSMREIWHAAKCTDIQKSGWLTYEQHVCNDRRGCEGCRSNWSNALDVGNPPPGPGEWVGSSGAGPDLLMFIWSIRPQACAESPPIPTGLIVDIRGSAHPDAFCPGVNCWYNFGSGSCTE